jgi:hypothetical protein
MARPSKAYLATLHDPTQEDYDRMVGVAMQAMFEDQQFVYLSFSHLAKYPEGFPKGVLVGKYGNIVTRKIKPNWLLKWLHESGYTQYNYVDVRLSKRTLGYTMDKLDSMFELEGEE